MSDESTKHPYTLEHIVANSIANSYALTCLIACLKKEEEILSDMSEFRRRIRQNGIPSASGPPFTRDELPSLFEEIEKSISGIEHSLEQIRDSRS